MDLLSPLIFVTLIFVTFPIFVTLFSSPEKVTKMSGDSIPTGYKRLWFDGSSTSVNLLIGKYTYKSFVSLAPVKIRKVRR